jgi:rod shape determining protein RodA
MQILKTLDWKLIAAMVPLLGAGLITMYSFTEVSYFFSRQVFWIISAFLLLFIFSLIDWRFLRRGGVLLSFYLVLILILLFLVFGGSVVRGAQSWIQIGAFTFQPADFMKLVLILVLAKYFSRRHVAIANTKHVIISGIYAGLPAFLILLQPDFGSAVIISLIWLGMVMVSGVSKKHLAMVLLVGILAVSFLWLFGFTDVQKARITTFIDPLADIQGAGYNAYQSTIAVGSGGSLGKGIGYGTQSRLQFLPEFETDFIFAAFAEEWGFVGVLILFSLFGVVFWRILNNAYHGDTNFEILFGLGLAIMFMSHFFIHIGMNIGLLPVTGLTIPFLSYGGSHIIVELSGIGILMGMRRYARVTHKEKIEGEELIGYANI